MFTVLLSRVASRVSSLFFLMTPRPPISTLFPYTTLFRSHPVPTEKLLPLFRQGVQVTWELPSCQITPARNKSKERSEEHTSELQSRGHLVCRLLLEKKKKRNMKTDD